MAKHIAFFYNPNAPKKLDNLRRLILAAETYGDLYHVDIMIHTQRIVSAEGVEVSFNTAKLGYKCNNPSSLCPIVSILVHNMQSAVGRAGHWLTWYHRYAMSEQLKGETTFPYDLYLYVEDDTIVPRESLDYFLQYNKIARKSTGCTLGFNRVYDNAYTMGVDYIRGNHWLHGGLYRYGVKDGTSYSSVNNAAAASNIITGEWAQMTRESNYWGGWIMADDDPVFGIRGFRESDEFPIRMVPDMNMIREIAAWGWHAPTKLSNSKHPGRLKCTVVPLVNASGGDEGGNQTKLLLHPDAKVYHLGEKYVPADCRTGKLDECGGELRLRRCDTLDFSHLPKTIDGKRLRF